EPSDSHACLASADVRFSASAGFIDAGDPTTCANTPVTAYSVTFDSTNWYKPVQIQLHARQIYDRQDPHNTGLIHTIDASTTTDPLYAAAAPNGTAPRVQERIDVLAISDREPGVFVLQKDGDTVVQLCGNPTCTVGGIATDAYSLRLTSQPTSDVTIFIFT